MFALSCLLTSINLLHVFPAGNGGFFSRCLGSRGSIWTKMIMLKPPTFTCRRVTSKQVQNIWPSSPFLDFLVKIFFVTSYELFSAESSCRLHFTGAVQMILPSHRRMKAVLADCNCQAWGRWWPDLAFKLIKTSWLPPELCVGHLVNLKWFKLYLVHFSYFVETVFAFT